MRPRTPAITLLGIALLVLSTATSSFTQPSPPRRVRVEQVNGRPVAAGEVLVRLRSDLPAPAQAALARFADAASMRPIGRGGLQRLRSRTLDAATLMARLSRHADVSFVEPNYVVHASVEPPDPLLPQLWGLQNIGQAVNGGGAGRPGADIHAEAAWDLTFGSPDHVVAVIDTGIDYAHPDLAANMWSAPAPFTVTIGGIALTCPAGSHGFNALTFSCNPMDDHLHGTHVAGTIGAAGANGLGVVGVNWTTRLMGIKFLDASGAGTVADAIDGLEFVLQARAAFSATHGADVRILSNSWGGRDASQALLDEIAATNAAGMLFVAAAGNDGFSNDLWPAYPASYPVANIVAVAATTNRDDRAWFSNYGTRSVHLGAPGVDILSTVPAAGYAYSSGTSMATPHVSGAAALVLSRCDLDTPTLKRALLETVEPSAGLAQFTMTGGRLDVSSAVRSCTGPPSAPADVSARGGNGTVSLSWTRIPGAMRYTVRRGVGAGGPYTALTTVTGTTYTDKAVTNGTTYYYVVTASNLAGESGPSSEVSATPKAPSDLLISALNVPTIGGAGLPVPVSETTRNQGTGPSLATTTRFYLSRNSIFEPADTVLGSHAVPSLSSGTQSDITVSLDLPSGLSPGYWYVIARADADGVETETQEANNTTARLITIGPDLAVPAFAVPASAGAGAGLAVTASVKNQGGGSAGSSVTRFFLSANAVWDSTDLALEGRLDVSALSPGASASGTATVMLPANVAAGSYYVLAMADGDGAVVETQEANNAAARFVQIGGDLVVSGVTAPARAAAGGALAVTDTTKNNGAGAIGASVTRFHLSANALLDAGDVLLAAGRPVPALTAGASNTGTTTVVLPGQVAPGTWYLIAKADGDAAVSETLETNNTLARSVTVGPDLVISAMTVPYNVRAGGAVAVNDTVQNQGLDPAGATVTRFYLSSNVAFDANDVLLDGARVVGPLAGGASSVGSSSVTIPAGTAPGPWFVIARTDAGDTVTESTETNNLAARAVQVAP